jgi:hypothetical protein
MQRFLQLIGVGIGMMVGMVLASAVGLDAYSVISEGCRLKITEVFAYTLIMVVFSAIGWIVSKNIYSYLSFSQEPETLFPSEGFRTLTKRRSVL